ncbi:MAG: phosphoribosyltransferase family protein [Nitrososphaerota archaeon]
MLERVELYRGQRYHRVCVAGVIRNLPLVQVDEGLWIASNAGIIFGDIEFISAAAKAMAEKLRPLRPDIIITPEAKAIAFAYEVAKLLDHRRLIVARKSIKAYMRSYLVEEARSITTKERQIMILAREDAEEIAGKRVCILDDVVSTGGTMNALERLVERAGEKPICKAAIWIEGPWYRGDLIYLGELPVFATEDRLRALERAITHS